MMEGEDLTLHGHANHRIVQEPNLRLVAGIIGRPSLPQRYEELGRQTHYSSDYHDFSE